MRNVIINKNNNRNKAMLHLRVSRPLRDDVKKLADAMGVSMSLVGETLFKKFLEDKVLTLENSYIPNKNLKTILNEAERNRDNSKYWKTHASVEKLMADLKN